MAIEVDLLNNNNTVGNINTNMQRIKEALEDGISRSGATPNQMEADLDMNSNDILNVNRLQANDIIVDGEDLSDMLQEVVDARDIALEQAGIATAQANRAQNEADRAAGYVNDIVAEKEVPIYSTIAGMSSIAVSDGLNRIYVSGETSVGDGLGGMFVDTDNGTPVVFTSAAGDGAMARDWYRAADVGPARLTNSLLAFGADPTGTVPFDDAFIDFCEYLSANKVTGHIPAGTYSIGSNVFIEDLPDIHIVCDPGVVIENNGRIVEGGAEAVSPNRRCPWALAFFDCPNLRIDGNRAVLRTTGASGDYLGNSTGFWDLTNYETATPFLWIERCDGLRLFDIFQDGLAARPTSGSIQAMQENEEVDFTPKELAYWYLRTAFALIADCEDVVVDGCGLVPDQPNWQTENWTFHDLRNFRIDRITSLSSPGHRNFPSVAKVVYSKHGTASDWRIRDASTGSLCDWTGCEDVRIIDTHVDYPNGKFADISMEWNLANGPIKDILIKDCSSTGSGVIFSTLSTTNPFPITGCIIENFKAYSERTDSQWGGGADGTTIMGARATELAVRNCNWVNTAYPYTTSSVLEGQRVRFESCNFEYRGGAVGLATNGNVWTAGDVIQFFDCTMDGHRYSSPLQGTGQIIFNTWDTTPPLRKNAKGRIEWHGGVIRNAILSIRVNTKFIGVRFENVGFDFNSMGARCEFIDCMFDIDSAGIVSGLNQNCVFANCNDAEIIGAGGQVRGVADETKLHRFIVIGTAGSNVSGVPTLVEWDGLKFELHKLNSGTPDYTVPFVRLVNADIDRAVEVRLSNISAIRANVLDIVSGTNGTANKVAVTVAGTTSRGVGTGLSNGDDLNAINLVYVNNVARTAHLDRLASATFNSVAEDGNVAV